MKTIILIVEMESNDEEKPLSHYMPKSLGRVQEKTKDKTMQATFQSCKIFANLL
jgi:hypothetical protein